MSGAIPSLPNTPSWRGTQSSGTTLPLQLVSISVKFLLNETVLRKCAYISCL
jgi:hypothetical protein